MALIFVIALIIVFTIGTCLIYIDHLKNNSAFHLWGCICMFGSIALFLLLTITILARRSMTNYASTYVADYQSHPTCERELRTDRSHIKHDHLKIIILQDQNIHHIDHDQNIGSLNVNNIVHRADGKQTIKNNNQERQLHKSIQRNHRQIHWLQNWHHKGSTANLKSAYKQIPRSYDGFFHDDFYYYELRAVRANLHHPKRMRNHTKYLHHDSNIVLVDLHANKAYRKA